MASTIGKDYLLLDDGCKGMGIHRRTFNRLRREGKITAIRHGGRTYVSQRAIDDYWARLEMAADAKRTSPAAGGGEGVTPRPHAGTVNLAPRRRATRR